jgi:hypothetical protein
MTRPIAAAAAALLALAATACSHGPLATQSSSAGSSYRTQQCAGLSNPERQDCLNGDTSQHSGNRATGGAGGSSTGAPGMAGTSGGASGGMR